MNELTELERELTEQLVERSASASPPADAWDRLVAAMSDGPDPVVELTVEPPDLSEPTAAPSKQKRRIAAVAATAATILVLAGLVVMADGDSGDIVTGPAVGPSVTDSVSSYGWSRVPHDEVVFGGPEGGNMESVTVGGPGLVAVGSDGEGSAAVWTSVDGLTWSRVPHDEAVFGGPRGAGMSGVAAGGPGLVAVGSVSPHQNEDAAVWTSVDGLTWSRLPDDEAVFGGFGDQWMGSVVAGGPGLVAVGWDLSGFDADAAVWTSPDGVTWSRVPDDEEVFGGSSHQAMWGLTAGGPGLVAVGEDRSRNFDDGAVAVWTSVDGITWSRVPHDEAVFDATELADVTAGPPGLVAVGNAQVGGPGAVVLTSVDGLSWSRVPFDEVIFGGEPGTFMQSVTAGGPGLVAVGGSEGDDIGGVSAVWTSVDGLTWSRVPQDEAVFGGGGQMTSVTAAGPALIAVGGSDAGAAVWVGWPEN